MRKRILVVDDEETLCEVLRFNLEAEGYQVDTAYRAEDVLSMDVSVYDLMLLDIMMGEISGTQLAKILKANPSTSHIPIIFCTAKDSEDEMVEGLDLGADDYICKPYSLRNIIIRVKTVLRRTTNVPVAKDEENKIVYEGLEIILSRKICHVDGKEISLPRKEFEILKMLVKNVGRVFTREELLREIWPDEVIVLDRVIDVNIARIRRKIGKYGGRIKSRSGYGYGFMD